MVVKPIVIRVAIVLAGIIVFALGRGLFYHSGFYTPPPSKIVSYEEVAVPMAPSTEFSDVYEPGEGKILIDLAHSNAFEVEELNVLTLRLISRGLNIEFFKAGDSLEKELLGEEVVEEEAEEEEAAEEEEVVEGEKEAEEEQAEQEEATLDEEAESEEEEALPDAFVVVCPRTEFSKKERETVDEFVNNGGKLLLIAEPTNRSNKMNSLSLDFGLIFEPDYLYNIIENEINYRNIFITQFKENEITKDLKQIALYTTGSISSADEGIAFTDENTLSSLIETREKLSPLALANDSKVLAVYDLTFMTEPHNGILDNNQLIANIADWLATPAEEEEEEL